MKNINNGWYYTYHFFLQKMKNFRPICGYKLVGVIPHKKLIMRHINPFSSPSDAVRDDLLRKLLMILTRV